MKRVVYVRSSSSFTPQELEYFDKYDYIPTMKKLLSEGYTKTDVAYDFVMKCPDAATEDPLYEPLITRIVDGRSDRDMKMDMARLTTNLDTLNKLGSSSNGGILDEVTANPNCSSDILDKIAHSVDLSKTAVVNNIVNHPNTALETKVYLIKRKKNNVKNKDVTYRIYWLDEDGDEDDFYKVSSKLDSAIRLAENETKRSGFYCHIVICPKKDLTISESEAFREEYGYEPYEIVWSNYPD